MGSKCPICEGVGKLLFPGRVLLDRHCDVFCCRLCGLIYLKNYKYAEGLRRENLYWSDKTQENIYLDEDVRYESRMRFASYLNKIERYVQGRKLLDVGCGTGIFLEVARSRGWDCCGLDISSEAVDIAKQKLKLPIEVGMLENGLFVNDKFDIITMWNVIEHLVEPQRTLREVYHRLNDGGFLVLETSNEDFLFRGINKALFKDSSGRISFLPKYFYYQDHLFYFSPRTLSNLLRTAGPFDIKKINYSLTDMAFLKKKLKIYYAHKSKLFYKMIPFFLRLSSVFMKGNKMVVYAKKL